ncbi:MAG: hypothetical protein E4G74_03235 [Erysipelotrichales bacterium]|nr:MAG: hypothetical protein E4G74_03235 [Erysipelotrichales bacterium]
MKHKIITILFVFLLIGCNSNKKAIDKTDEYYFKIADHEIAMGQEAAAVVASLGEPIDRYSSPSCAFEGEDTVYDFGSYQITTYLSDGIEKFTGFYLIDGTVSTKEGIHIGSSYDEMVSIYGNDYVETYGAYTYSRGLTDLSFVIINDEITSISYLYAVD